MYENKRIIYTVNFKDLHAYIYIGEFRLMLFARDLNKGQPCSVHIYIMQFLF